MAASGLKNNANQQVILFGVQVSSSLYNSAIPVLYGGRKISLKLINSWDFRQGGGSTKKGKGPQGGQPNFG
jgi:hypothetical protein